MGSRYSYDTLLLGKKLRVELRTGHWLSWQYDWQPWQVQVNGQSLLLAVARDDGEAVVPLDKELECLQGINDDERVSLRVEIQQAVDAGGDGRVMVETACGV